jgi:hypothetical protein
MRMHAGEGVAAQMTMRRCALPAPHTMEPGRTGPNIVDTVAHPNFFLISYRRTSQYGPPPDPLLGSVIVLPRPIRATGTAP